MPHILIKVHVIVCLYVVFVILYTLLGDGRIQNWNCRCRACIKIKKNCYSFIHLLYIHQLL